MKSLFSSPHKGGVRGGLFLLICLLLAGCKHIEYVTVPELHTDTVYQHQVQRDSVFLHDSIHIHERGDTVFYDRWHTKYIERVRIDTLREHRIDSIAVPYPVEKIVEKKYTPRFVKFLAWIGGVILFLGITYVGFRLYRILRP